MAESHITTHDKSDVIEAGKNVIIEMPSGNAKIINLKAKT
jgi:hypothetical protein